MSSDTRQDVYVDSGIKQPYHLVRPSPWPLIISFAAGLMMFGAVLWMHEITLLGMPIGPKGFVLGLLGVLFVMFMWWRDIIRESIVEKAHSDVVKIGLRYGMALFIASEVMFFAAFFWAYFDAALFPKEAINFLWPPADIKTFDPFHLPFMMTLILLLSGCTVTWAHHAVLEGKNDQVVQALRYTVLLGISFSGFQFYEYSHAAFGMDDTVYGSTFYLATGFHGLHVIIGTIFLAVCWWRAAQGHFTKERHFGLEAAAWYWHFVDVVWLFLFISIYWYGAHPAIAAGH